MAVWLLPPAHAPRLSLRERGKALADHRVLGILAGTVTVLTPVFLVIAYLPAIMRTSGAWIVVAMLGYGAGQVTGTVLVPRLIRRRGARTALVCGACGITAVTAILTATRTIDATAVVTMAVARLLRRPHHRPPAAQALRRRAQARARRRRPQRLRDLHRHRARRSRGRDSTRHRRQRRPARHRSGHRAARRHRRRHNRPPSVTRQRRNLPCHP